jgi:hypothetical protein
MIQKIQFLYTLQSASLIFLAQELSALCGSLGKENCTAVEYCDKNPYECSSGCQRENKNKQCTNREEKYIAII